MYTYAFNAVRREMKGRGFVERQSDKPTDETVVMFEKLDTSGMPIIRCGLTGFPKPNDLNSMEVSTPFKFLHLKGQEFSKNVSLEINLTDVPDDNEAIEKQVKKWLDELLPKSEWWGYCPHTSKIMDNDWPRSVDLVKPKHLS